ncbi:Spore protein SP21 [Chlamydia trachomatis]|jgi:small heat shock protein|uniref:Spore protein SP21 n=1 Tax=Candidatus Nanogingivalis gingivitcus TaxID=2171992 RepID=A0ABY0FJN4_9BACT|nr:Hsp20/alpha crystallin family protein [Candidatus Nanogingivalis gingivitcus]RYC72477.1 Spore protein SP21 [Candidatus Nanogingivalis gingivitcus]CRH92723.1 Spore protein SP21 [Chlamydia trachomatis]
MARRQDDDSFLKDELEAAFDFGDDLMSDTSEQVFNNEGNQNNFEQEEENELPGQLAVDVYETEDRLFVKARTAGVNKNDLDVSLSDGTLTISGTLSAGDQEGIIAHHAQECYWGEFSRTLSLPVQVAEEGVEAMLKDGILTISFTKIKTQATKIQVL